MRGQDRKSQTGQLGRSREREKDRASGSRKERMTTINSDEIDGERKRNEKM